MPQRKICVTAYDKERLVDLLEVAERANYGGADDIMSLEGELERARVVEAKDVPADVVTMNTRLEMIDLDTNETITFTLVFPRDVNIDEDRISVLAPLGTAVLGYRVGDTIKWRVPAGVRRFRITKVLYQPEASGEYKQ